MAGGAAGRKGKSTVRRLRLLAYYADEKPRRSLSVT